MIYYAIIPDELFNAPIPDMVKDYMEYPEIYLLKDCIYGTPQQLEDGRWLIDTRFRSYDHTEIWLNGVKIQDKPGIANNNTNRYLYPQELEMWKQWVAEENILTDIEGLIFKQ